MSVPVSVSILGKEYQVSCPQEEKPALIASAELLHDNMESIRASGKIIGLDRIAVMAALNLAHELIALQNQKDQGLESVNTDLDKMSHKINHFLNEIQQLDL